MRLKVKYKNSAYKGPGSYVFQQEHNTYIGRVVTPKQKWMSENEFYLTTGNIDSPLRILDKRDIVEAWIGKDDVDDNVTLVSGDNKTYVVTKGSFNRYSCTCTCYNYRKWCNHINEVKKNGKAISNKA